MVHSAPISLDPVRRVAFSFSEVEYPSPIGLSAMPSRIQPFVKGPPMHRLTPRPMFLACALLVCTCALLAQACSSEKEGSVLPDFAQQTEALTFEEANGVISIEAENFTSNTAQGGHAWAKQTLSGATGGAAMAAAPDTGANNTAAGAITASPRLDYVTTFPSAGTYYVWVRGRAPTANTYDGDSLHLGLNGAVASGAERITGFSTTWGWTRSTMGPPVAVLNVATAGTHTVNVWMREDGFTFDKLVLTRAVNWAASGDGPAETAVAEPTPSNCAAATIEAEAMAAAMTTPVGGAVTGGWNIWSNGSLTTNHTFEAGTTTLTVTAQGTQAVGVWPNMTISVGGQQLGQVPVGSANWAEYTFPVTTAGGSLQISVTFDNDYYDSASGADRNLMLDKLVVGCVACEDGDTRVGTTGCATGTLEQVCVAGVWQNSAVCLAPCTEGDTEPTNMSCGLNGRGTLDRVCSGGAWTDVCTDYDVCTDGELLVFGPCGFNQLGTYLRECVEGQFTDWVCDDPDECRNGDTKPGYTYCGTNNAGRLQHQCVGGVWQDGSTCLAPCGLSEDDPCVVDVVVKTPAAFRPQELPFIANGSLRVAAGSTVNGRYGDPGVIANLGGNSGSTQLDANSHIKAAMSLPTVNLASSAVVDSYLYVKNGGYSPSNVTLNYINQSFKPELVDTFHLPIDVSSPFARDKTARVLDAAADAHDLNSISGRVHMNSFANGQVSGYQVFDQLTLDEGAYIRFFGSTVLVVRDELRVRGSLFTDILTSKILTARNLLVVYLGNKPVFLSHGFAGTLLAPNAAVTLYSSPDYQYYGSIIAKDVLLETNTVFNHVPFDHWERLLSPSREWRRDIDLKLMTVDEQLCMSVGETPVGYALCAEELPEGERCEPIPEFSQPNDAGGTSCSVQSDCSSLQFCDLKRGGRCEWHLGTPRDFEDEIAPLFKEAGCTTCHGAGGTTPNLAGAGLNILSQLTQGYRCDGTNGVIDAPLCSFRTNRSQLIDSSRISASHPPTFGPDSPHYTAVAQWIAQGAPAIPEVRDLVQNETCEPGASCTNRGDQFFEPTCTRTGLTRRDSCFLEVGCPIEEDTGRAMFCRPDKCLSCSVGSCYEDTARRGACDYYADLGEACDGDAVDLVEQYAPEGRHGTAEPGPCRPCGFGLACVDGACVAQLEYPGTYYESVAEGYVATERGLGERCGPHTSCVDGAACADSINICVERCTTDAHCDFGTEQTLECQNGQCVATCALSGDACGSLPCCGGEACVAGTCGGCVSEGDTCNSSGDCCGGGDCVNGVCRSDCGPTEIRCDDIDNDCDGSVDEPLDDSWEQLKQDVSGCVGCHTATPPRDFFESECATRDNVCNMLYRVTVTSAEAEGLGELSKMMPPGRTGLADPEVVAAFQDYIAEQGISCP